jgi:hypothetical protein
MGYRAVSDGCWSKFWVGTWWVASAELVGSLLATGLRLLVSGFSSAEPDGTFRWFALGAFLSGVVVWAFWHVVWPDEVVCGTVAGIAGASFGGTVGMVVGFCLPILVLVCLYD